MANITYVLQTWYDLGVFHYVIPGLLIFAIVYAILEKTTVLGENKAVNVIIGLSVALLSLQFDFVSSFFATIFPKFGIALSILLVFLLLLSISGRDDGDLEKWYFYIGLAVAVGAVVWAISSWGLFSTQYDTWNLGWWIRENFWGLVVAVLVIIAIVLMTREGGTKAPKVPKAPKPTG